MSVNPTCIECDVKMTEVGEFIQTHHYIDEEHGWVEQATRHTQFACLDCTATDSFTELLYITDDPLRT